MAAEVQGKVIVTDSKEVNRLNRGPASVLFVLL